MLEGIMEKFGYIPSERFEKMYSDLLQEIRLQSQLIHQKETTIQELAEQVRKYAPVPKKRGRPAKKKEDIVV
jgi:archaellum component FlaC